jgi:site-specific DNA-cytosine methylase
MEAYVDEDGSPLHYAVRPFLVNSMWYGVPQSRNRVFIIGCKYGACLTMHPAEFLDRVEDFLKIVQLEPPNPASRLLLDQCLHKVATPFSSNGK